MIRRDFHNWAVDDARHEIELIIGRIRMRAGSEDVEFITGHGPIRQAVIETLFFYDLSPRPQLGNTGVIVATIS